VSSSNGIRKLVIRLLSTFMTIVLMSSYVLAAAPVRTVNTSQNQIVVVMSFKEWKSDKLFQAKILYSKLETEYLDRKNSNPKDPNLKNLYTDLKIRKSNLDEIDELTVSDYFVGYLSRFKDKKAAFQSAAKNLDFNEVAELMSAYADSLLKTTGDGLSANQQKNPAEASK
jgi:hypothetical protein